MKNQKLLIEYTPDFVRAALFEDGKLCELHHERPQNTKKTESLYWGRVVSIRPSVGAAFVDIGLDLHAFLPLEEGKRIKCGDCLIVQGIAVQSVDSKGMRISDRINLAGKWLVLVPGDHGVHISKKIKDGQLREALTHAVEDVCPENCGLIVRTASTDVTRDMLVNEARALEQLWHDIQLKAKGMTRPGILHEPLGLEQQLIRDVGSTLSSIVVNDAKAAERIGCMKESGWIPLSVNVEFFEERTQLLCDVYSIDPQVDKALKKRVWLDCGGYLVIDLCEALTVIDVNSGKMVLGRDTEDTAFRVNLEAAREIARQIRLRDIGGIIIVDYIDMMNEQHRQQLLQVICDEAKNDRSQVTVAGMTKLGLVEMTRKRKGVQLDKALRVSCKTCSGCGQILSADENASRALRQVRRMIVAGQRGPFLIHCALPVVQALASLTAPDHKHAVYAVAENGWHFERFEINQLDDRAPLTKKAVQLKG